MTPCTKPYAILLAGHAATGKTRFSRSLLGRAMEKGRSLAFLDKDTIAGRFSRELMLLHTGDGADRDSCIFQSMVRPLEYSALLDVARENLQAGVSTILCAPFGRECKTSSTYEDFIHTAFTGIATPILVWAHVDAMQARQRIEKRRHPMDAYKLNNWQEYVQRRYEPSWVYDFPHNAKWLQSGINNEEVLNWLEEKIWSKKNVFSASKPENAN